MPGEDTSWGGGVTQNQLLGGMGEDSSWGGTLTQRQLEESGGLGGGGGEGGSPTGLSIIDRTATGFTIASSTGADAITPPATTSLAGLLTAADKTTIDALALIAAALQPVATSGAYADLSGRPTLGDSALKNVGTVAGTVAAGDDARLSDARSPTTHTHTAAQISDASTAGKALLLATNEAAQRTALGLSAVASSGSYSDLSGQPTIPTPGGTTGQVQFRALSGAFTGAAGVVIDPTSGQLTLASFLAGAAPGTPATGFALYSNASNALSWKGANGFTRTFDGTSNTEDRSYTLQNKSGTIAHLDDIPSAGGTRTFPLFIARDNHPPATNNATLDTRNVPAVLEFDPTTEETTFFIGVIPEGANTSSGLRARIWGMGDTATTGNVRLAAAFERMNTDLDADSFDTAAEATSTASAASGTPWVTEITCTTIDGLVAGDLFRLRIARKAADAVNDTMAGDFQLLAVEVRQVA
jgi:hypothetical protein